MEIVVVGEKLPRCGGFEHQDAHLALFKRHDIPQSQNEPGYRYLVNIYIIFLLTNVYAANIKTSTG